MTVIGVVGGGQLARMMIPGAINLGITLRVFAQSPDDCAAPAITAVGDFRSAEDLMAFCEGLDVLTFDHEHVPVAVLEALEASGVSVYPRSAALALTHDKTVMRAALAQLDIPQPRWAVLGASRNPEEVLQQVGGFPCVAKLPIGGYDGKGVRVIESFADIEDWMALGDVLLEERVNFVRELAQLGARRPGGSWVSWDAVETVQANGVCSEVIAPAVGLTEAMRADAARIGSRIAHDIDVVGILAVELFETADGVLLVNELAMRPHNSGHVFTELSVTSQFEQHLRAVSDFPLGATTLRAAHGVMVNIFGGVDPDAARSVADNYPAIKIHSYDKSPRPGRKAGHLVASGSQIEFVLQDARDAGARMNTGRYDG
jgi:5-(carboxyamino)imidazole ribonucleotide synthase